MAGLFTAVTALSPTTNNNGCKADLRIIAFCLREQAHDSWANHRLHRVQGVMSYVKWPRVFDDVDRPHGPIAAAKELLLSAEAVQKTRLRSVFGSIKIPPDLK